MFDRDFNYLDGCYQPLSNAPLEQGQNVPHERLYGQTVIKTAGYVYVYVSNEGTTTPYEVYFDDLSVEHIKSPIIQAEDYYPFGLTFNGYNRENAVANDYLYNGKERQDELGLGWFDHGARMYNPSIGRWSSIDPNAYKYSSDSPYQYAFNDPIKIVDLNGKDGVIYLQIIYNEDDSEEDRKNINQTMTNVTRMLNNAFKQLGIDLKVKLDAKSNRIMGKREFYSRKGANKADSYLIVGNSRVLHDASSEAMEKGWDKIYGEGDNCDFTKLPGEATSGENDDDLFEFINTEYLFRKIEQGFDIDDFTSAEERGKAIVEHESGHPKFYDHPDKIGAHVRDKNSIMTKLPKCDAYYDAWMIERLIKIHGAATNSESNE